MRVGNALQNFAGHTALSVPLLVLTLCDFASAQDHQSLNEANNPLTPKITINFQNYYDPSLYGLPGRDANQFLFRGLVPWKFADHGQLFRFTVPLATTPSGPSDDTTSIGDLTFMNLTPFAGPGHTMVAAGPILVVPGNDAVGTGRWQAGAAGVLIAPQSWGILGALATYQHSFAENHDREPVSVLTFQPIVNINLPEQFYLRSSATWSFNLQQDGSFIPFGLGIGRVISLSGGNTLNAFVEPQYTLWHDGDGAPRWQIFAGVNLQFSTGQ